MNERHAVIFDYGGRCVVAEILGDQVRTFHTEDFKKRYQNRTVAVGKRSIPLGDWWLGHEKREEYYELVLRPDTLNRVVWKDGRRCLNLWRGFSVTPRKGHTVSLFLWLLLIPKRGCCLHPSPAQTHSEVQLRGC
jgi:hypothetical protein